MFKRAKESNVSARATGALGIPRSPPLFPVYLVYIKPIDISHFQSGVQIHHVVIAAIMVKEGTLACSASAVALGVACWQTPSSLFCRNRIIDYCNMVDERLLPSGIDVQRDTADAFLVSRVKRPSRRNTRSALTTSGRYRRVLTVGV